MMSKQNLTSEEFEQMCRIACQSFVPSYDPTNDDLIIYRRLIISLCDRYGGDKRKILDRNDLVAQSYKTIIEKSVAKLSDEKFDGVKIAEKHINAIK